MAWRYSVGNLTGRAPASPAAVSPAAEDPALPLVNLGSGYPDQEGALVWRSDGTYAVDFDLNLLAVSSERADAPTGWSDLLNVLAGTPGLPADAPGWDTYAGRTALRLYRPLAQDVDVMPGEAVRLTVGLYRPSGSTATGCRVRVVDLSTGDGWEGGTTDTWQPDGVVDEQTTADAWLDVSVEIAAAAGRAERAGYRVILEPVAASYGSGTHVYASAPRLDVAVDLCAIVGHNIPAGATCSLAPQPSGTSLSLTPAQPSFYAVAVAPQFAGTWRLSVEMPGGSDPRPILGEVWIGSARTMLVGSPVPTFGGEETAAGQVRVEGPRKRVEVVPDSARPVASLELEFRARDDAAFGQMRNEVMRLTRFGTDPLLLLPGSSFDGGRIYHGRVEDKLSWSVITPTDTGAARSFAMPFVESPFAGT